MKKQAIITENSMEYLITTGKRGEKKYCLEVDTSVWQPTHPGDICPEYMLRFCRARGLADLEWYVNLLEEKITKEEKNKTTGEVIKTVQRKRTPSEVKQAFIDRYFPNTVKRVKDEDYYGHASKAKKLLAEMKAAQPTAKKAATKE
jgi:hypothetical protein